jgi:hypothetical protein
VYAAKSLSVVAFGPDDPLTAIGNGTQVSYLRSYLHDLGARCAIHAY